MTNEEIDFRLKAMSIAIPDHAKRLMSIETPEIARELELLNMSVMTIWVMLGEIAKRMPEVKQ